MWNYRDADPDFGSWQVSDICSRAHFQDYIRFEIASKINNIHFNVRCKFILNYFTPIRHHPTSGQGASRPLGGRSFQRSSRDCRRRGALDGGDQASGRIQGEGCGQVGSEGAGGLNVWAPYVVELSPSVCVTFD